MAGVRTLANGRRKWAILTVKPAGLAAVKVSELTAGINVGDRATNAGSYLRASGSTTVDSTHFNSEAASQALGASNWEGQIEPYLYLDATTGKVDATDSALHTAVATKGATLWIVERRGPKEPVAWATGDVYRLFEVITDQPQSQDTSDGYMRDVVPLVVQSTVTGTVTT